VPLEVSQDSNVDEIKRKQTEKQTEKSTVVEDSKENRRPLRAAAIVNELLREELLKNKLL
jgi:hypothetical protein